jgi:hypothetical protein
VFEKLSEKSRLRRNIFDLAFETINVTSNIIFLITNPPNTTYEKTLVASFFLHFLLIFLQAKINAVNSESDSKKRNLMFYQDLLFGSRKSTQDVLTASVSTFLNNRDFVPVFNVIYALRHPSKPFYGINSFYYRNLILADVVLEDLSMLFYKTFRGRKSIFSAITIIVSISLAMMLLSLVPLCRLVQSVIDEDYFESLVDYSCPVSRVVPDQDLNLTECGENLSINSDGLSSRDSAEMAGIDVVARLSGGFRQGRSSPFVYPEDVPTADARVIGNLMAGRSTSSSELICHEHCRTEEDPTIKAEPVTTASLTSDMRRSRIHSAISDIIDNHFEQQLPK